MSSGRLFLDRVARQHCPSPLRRQGHHKSLDQRIESKYHRTGSTLVTVYLDCGDPGIAARFWTRELEPLYLRVPAGIVFARLKVIAGALSLVRREYALADQLFTAALNANEEQKSLGSNELA